MVPLVTSVRQSIIGYLRTASDRQFDMQSICNLNRAKRTDLKERILIYVGRFREASFEQNNLLYWVG